MSALPEDLNASRDDRSLTPRRTEGAPPGKSIPLDFDLSLATSQQHAPEPEPDLTVSSFMTDAMLSDFGHDEGVPPAPASEVDAGSEDMDLDLDLDVPR